MGKLLKGCGVIAIVFVIGFIALLVWAGKAGGAIQEQFFTAVLSGNPKSVTALMAPELAQQIEEPVLASWMAAVKTNLGNFAGLDLTKFNTSTKTEGGVTKTESSGGVKFDKGTAESKLVLANGLIISFHVKSDQLGNWLTDPPAETTLYRTRGQECLTKILSNQIDAAFAMMHESLQKQLPQQKPAITGLAQKIGALKSVTYKSEQAAKAQGDKPATLTIIYDVACQNAQLRGTVEFGFLPFKGHILAYNLASAK